MLVTNNLSTSTPKLEVFFKEYTHVFYIDYFYKFVLDKKKIPDVSGISSIFIICELE